jgi:hypothetical protein
MKENILRARIKVLGGDKLIETFDDFAKHGAFAMKLVDKEAEKATREVQKLKRQLEELDLVARSIRAKIKIDKDRGPTAAQAASLALAENLERQAAITRQKLAAAEQGLFMQPGQMARTISAGLNEGMDLFDADRLGKELAESLKAADLGEAILSKADRTAIEKVARNFQKITSKTRDDLAVGIDSKDRKAAAAAEAKAIADAERAQRKADEAAKKRLDEAGKRLEEAHRNTLARIDAEAEAADKVRDEAERENRRRVRSEEQMQEVLSRKRAERERREAATAEEIFAEHYRQRQFAEEEAEYQRKRALDTARKDEAEFERNRLAALKKAEQDSARRGAGQSRVPIIPRQDTARPWGDEAARGLDNAGRAAGKAAKDIGEAEKAAGRAERAMSSLGRSGGGVEKMFGGISRGVKGTLSDLNKFTSALTNFEHALGNVALRTGVAAIILGIADALAVLGGGAALAGIAALAGLAAFDAAKLQRFAEANNMSLESFTKLRSAAAQSGVSFDDYAASVDKARAALLGIHKGEKRYEDAAALAARYHISIYNAAQDDVADFESFLRQITEVYNSFPKGIQRKAFLEAFGIEALEPLIKKGNKGLTELIANARKFGVVLTDADVSKWEEMRDALWATWEIVKGMGYKLSTAISPDLMPVLQAINKWLIDNSDRIVRFLVDSFNYLMQVVKDFWAMWTGHPELVKHEWVQQVWNFHKAVIEVFTDVGKAIKKAYDVAHPALQKLGELIYGKDDKNAGLKLTLTALGASLLGVTGLVKSFVGVVTNGFGLAWGAGKRFLLPIIGWVGRIVGWPLALAGSAYLVWEYWDDVKAAAGKFWDWFSATFPGAAGVLEKAFNDAKPHVESFFSSFKEKYPNLATTIDDIGDALERVKQDMSSWDWGEIDSDAWTLIDYLVTNLLESMNTLKPLLVWVIKDFYLGTMAVIESLGIIYNWIKDIVGYVVQSATAKDENGVPAGKRWLQGFDHQDEPIRNAAEWASIGSAPFKALNRFIDWYNEPQKQAAAAAAAIAASHDRMSDVHAMANPATQRPLGEVLDPQVMGKYIVELASPDSPDPITLATNDDNIGRFLTQASSGRAAITTPPSWNRRF